MRLFAGFLVLVLCSSAASAEEITIQYTAENLIPGHPDIFIATLTLDTVQKPLHDIMFDAAEIDPRFQFRTLEHEEFGHYVIEMNNIPEDPANGYFWALIKRDHPDTPEERDCLLSHAGVSTYLPFDGEHMVFSYETYDVFDRLPDCPVPDNNNMKPYY